MNLSKLNVTAFAPLVVGDKPDFLIHLEDEPVDGEKFSAAFKVAKRWEANLDGYGSWASAVMDGRHFPPGFGANLMDIAAWAVGKGKAFKLEAAHFRVTDAAETWIAEGGWAVPGCGSI